MYVIFWVEVEIYHGFFNESGNCRRYFKSKKMLCCSSWAGVFLNFATLELCQVLFVKQKHLECIATLGVSGSAFWMGQSLCWVVVALFRSYDIGQAVIAATLPLQHFLLWCCQTEVSILRKGNRLLKEQFLINSSELDALLNDRNNKVNCSGLNIWHGSELRQQRLDGWLLLTFFVLSLVIWTLLSGLIVVWEKSLDRSDYPDFDIQVDPSPSHYLRGDQRSIQENVWVCVLIHDILG